jgi:hypothetical protein
MDLHHYTTEELETLIKLKYPDPAAIPIDELSTCPLLREQIVREWIRERHTFSRSTGAQLEQRFRELERILNLIVHELKTPKTYSLTEMQSQLSFGPSTYRPPQPPTTFTLPPIVQNPSIPYPFTI